jgi:hypothetical protein
VPERYFSFLRSVESGVLEDVFAHHLQDIESLVSLLARIEGVFADPSESAARSEDVDRFQLGRMLLDQGRSEGAEVLDTVIRSEPSARETIRAAHVLARHYRYAGRIEAAADVWDRVYRRHGSVAAGIERAKYLEHRLRDFRGAEELVLKLIARPHSLPFRSDLEKRLERVRRRASRR